MNYNYKINFAKHAKRFLIIAIVLMLVSISSLIFKGLDFGIDFKGGTIVTIELNKKFTTDEIKNITDKYDPKAEITSSGDNATQVVISTSKDLSDSERKALFNDFKAEYKLDNKDLLSIDNVSGTIGDELKSMAIKACIITVICMLIYITFRFEFLQGLCAVFALIFDLCMVVGVFSIFDIQVNSTFIAAILTILGYSINDTIITFDRVRENVIKVAKGDFYNLTNISINQTMRRSINTTLTTLLAVTPLLIFGTTSIREFVFPMMIGFISGVFSSICVAVPMWYLIKEYQKKKNPKSVNMSSKKASKLINQDLLDPNFKGSSEYSYNADYEKDFVMEKSEEELLKEKEERKAKRKARKEKKKKRKKGQR